MLLEDFLGLLWIISVILLIVGLVKPNAVIRWGDEEKKKRTSVLKYYGISSIILFVIFASSIKTDDDIKDKELSEGIEQDEIEKKFELLSTDDNLLSKNYDDLSYEETKRLDLLLDNFSDLSEEDQEKIIDDINRLEEQKIAKEEEEARILAEKEAEEARIKAEKEAEEARLQAEYEKEKYNTNITRDDMARDKDGLKGSYVTFYGRIAQVMNGSGYTQYRMAVNDDSNQMVLLEIEDSKLDSNILEGDYITIEGESVGNISYTTVLGSELTIPGIVVDNVYY